MAGFIIIDMLKVNAGFNSSHLKVCCNVFEQVIHCQRQCFVNNFGILLGCTRKITNFPDTCAAIIKNLKVIIGVIIS